MPAWSSPRRTTDPGRDQQVVTPLSHVNVWSVDHELLVTWRGGGPDLSVFVSTDPDDAGADVRAPDASGRTVIPRVAGRRQYVHLFDPGSGFVVAAERRLPFDGPRNFRDLGGYPTSTGRPTRWGRVFRSDRMDGLSDRDHESLQWLGIDVVFDLRSTTEVDHAPDRLSEGIEHVHVPLTSDLAQTRTIMQRIQDGDLRSFSGRDMAAGYLRMLTNFVDAFTGIVDRVAAGDRVVVHCSAGKDRTGLAAMLLLGLAGVGDAYILDDYELSERFSDPDAERHFAGVLRELGHDPAEFAVMWSSPRSVMQATLTGVRERWGSADGYLSDAGSSAETLTTARENLLVDR